MLFFLFRLTLFSSIQIVKCLNRLSKKQKQRHTMEMEENKVVVIRLCPYFIRARNEQSGDIKYDTGKSSKLMPLLRVFSIILTNSLICINLSAVDVCREQGYPQW